MGFFSLLKREWLEHKATFIWVPLIVSALIVVFTLSMYQATSDVVIETSQESREVIDGVVHVREDKRAVSLSEVLAGKDGAWKAADVRDYFHIPLVAIVLFGLLSSTLDERKDGSILFFKSMPVSDTETILSKYVFMAWVAPLVTLGCILLLQLALATWSSFNPNSWPQFAGQGVGGYLQFSANTIVSYALYGLWALPAFAFVLLIGAWANRGALLWVIGIPLGISVVEMMVNKTEHVEDFLLRHLSPKLQVDLSSPNAGSDLLAQTITVDFWLGVIIGLGLLGLAVYCRRTRNEI